MISYFLPQCLIMFNNLIIFSLAGWIAKPHYNECLFFLMYRLTPCLNFINTRLSVRSILISQYMKGERDYIVT